MRKRVRTKRKKSSRPFGKKATFKIVKGTLIARPQKDLMYKK